jgi:acyl dehydratase
VSATRALHLTDEMLHAYSRRGNFHSEPAEAERLGLPGIVAQGMQVAGPAYALLLEAWGDDFLDHGELDLKFVGMVTGGQTVDAAVAIAGDDATIEVTNRDTALVSVVGSARRRA